jgi:hypothetical protein
MPGGSPSHVGIFQRKFEWLFKYRDESNLNEEKTADRGRA